MSVLKSVHVFTKV